MTTELIFLLDLLLNHKLSKPTKDMILERVKEVEARLSVPPIINSASAYMPSIPNVMPIVQTCAPQAASTLAALARHPDLLAVAQQPAAAPPTVAQVAQTAATAKALADRQATINQGISGKPVKGETRPRKW